MENENEQAQEVVVEQEEQTTEEQTDNVTLTKADFNKMQRKAIAYDATKNKPKPEITNNSSLKPIDILRDDAFKLYREGYDEEDIDLILKNGGRDVLKNENSALTLGLKAKMEQKRAENAAGMTSGGSQLSEIERKYTPEQLKNMDTKELEKILPHA